MIKLFISQPMRGKTDEEISAVRLKAIPGDRQLKDGGDVICDKVI